MICFHCIFHVLCICVYFYVQYVLLLCLWGYISCLIEQQHSDSGLLHHWDEGRGHDSSTIFIVMYIHMCTWIFLWTQASGLFLYCIFSSWLYVVLYVYIDTSYVSYLYVYADVHLHILTLSYVYVYKVMQFMSMFYMTIVLELIIIHIKKILLRIHIWLN